ncbi:unnamed protein product [Merluccius merluccius]
MVSCRHGDEVMVGRRRDDITPIPSCFQVRSQLPRVQWGQRSSRDRKPEWTVIGGAGIPAPPTQEKPLPFEEVQ